MHMYSLDEVKQAHRVVCSILQRCEKTQLKFKEGTSQHSLLRNRIKALRISSALLQDEDISTIYSKQDLLKALPPIVSIISKCEKAQTKYQAGTVQHTRYVKIINPMMISKALLHEELNRRG